MRRSRLGAGAFAFVVFVLAVACGHAPSAARTDREAARVDSASARTRIAELQESFGRATLGDGVATRFDPLDREHLRPVIPGRTRAMKPATVVLPGHADEAVRLEDDTTHATLTFSLRGAAHASIATAHGNAIFSHALESADVIVRADQTGVEDFVAFARRPAKEELVYDVDVSAFAGARLVGNSFELLDRSGTPRFHVSPPYVVDAKRKANAARLSVEGCAFDTNPAAPWARATTPLGAAACELHVTWSAASYPVLVDPGWTTTGSMADGREYHRAVRLPSGKVLIEGGSRRTGGDPYLASAEIFDPATSTFAATGSMSAERPYTELTLLGNGKVLVVGWPGSQLYDPASGTWGSTGAMVTIRTNHTQTLLSTGKVLVAGGLDSSTGNPTTAAEIYDPGTNAFTVTGSMANARSYALAGALAGGKALVLGGFTATFDGIVTPPEVYDSGTGQFTAADAGFTCAARTAGSAIQLSSDTFMLSGSVNHSDVYTGATDTCAGTGAMTSASRNYLASAALGSGKVVVMGGIDLESSAFTNVDIWDPGTNAFTAGSPLSAPRAIETATTLTTGQVLVVGGESGLNNPALKSAEIYDETDAKNGAACQRDAQCDSQHCVDGVCCNSRCEEQCEACDVTGHVGACFPSVGPPHGTRTACQKSGACTASCDGDHTIACTYGPDVCASTCASGSETDSLCDTAGSCNVQAPHSCNNFTCSDDKTCRTSCTADGDCVDGFTCANGACAPKPGASVCVDDHTAADSKGNQYSCAPYKCKDGACVVKCDSIDDCESPAVCSSSGECAAAAAQDSGGCNAGGRKAPDAAPLFAALALLVARRRRTK